MKRFEEDEIRAARAFAMAGGQALHLHSIVFPNSPQCFKAAVNRGEEIAHLLDQDIERLKATARRLGVNTIFVDREGAPGQHIDLCSGPLRRALAMCTE